MPPYQGANWEPNERIAKSKDSHVMGSGGTTRHGREKGAGTL